MEDSLVLTFVLGLSILLQLIAAYFALRLIRITREQRAWLLIAAAITLMTIRRMITFYRLVSGDMDKPPDLSAEFVALTISILMVSGIGLISPLFLSIKRSEERIQNQMDYLFTLREVDRVITSNLDLEIMMTVTLEHVVSRLEIDAATILRIDRKSNRLRHAASKGFQSNQQISQADIKIGESYAGHVAQTQKIFGLRDLNGVKLEPNMSKMMASEKFVDYYCVPLVTKGKVEGVLEVFHRSERNPDDEWISFLEAMAGQIAIALENASLVEGLQLSNLELSQAYDTTLEGWSQALDMRDNATEGHTQRVADIVLQLARKMGLNGDSVVDIRRGALLHDIGKMGIPDKILLKPGPLTRAEWDVMRQHPKYAYDLLYPIEYLRSALDIPYCHHERWDGSGYPRQLEAEKIPLAARIFAVVDVWDALNSDRSYRDAWSRKKVINYLEDQSGKHFDPQVVAIFIEFLDEIIEV